MTSKTPPKTEPSEREDRSAHHTEDRDKSTVSAHNLGQDLRGKRDRATEACSLHAARSDGEADPQDGLKRGHLPQMEILKRIKAFQAASKKEEISKEAARDRRRFFLFVFSSLALIHLGFDRFFGIGQYFGLLSFLAPVPLAMGILAYGKARILKWAISLLALLCLGAWFVPSQVVLAGAYALTILYAYFIAIIIRCDIPPMRGILYTGTSLALVLWICVLGLEVLAPGGVQGYLTQMVEASLSRIPENENVDAQVLLNYLTTMGPVYITVIPFVAFWVCFFLIMRNFFLWGHRVVYTHSAQDLVRFRTPDYLLYPLALGLAASLSGTHFQIGGLSVFGNTLLGLVGVFYFFQGFGVFFGISQPFQVYRHPQKFVVGFDRRFGPGLAGHIGRL